MASQTASQTAQNVERRTNPLLPSARAAPAKPLGIVSWVGQLVVVAILGQTLFYKFSGASETVALFEVLGMGAAGRYGTALMELVAVVLLLVPRTAWAGGLVALGVISGAIMSHLTTLGVSIDAEKLGNPDLAPLEGPGLFVMALIVFAASAAVVVIRRRQIPVVGAALAGGGSARPASATASASGSGSAS